MQDDVCHDNMAAIVGHVVTAGRLTRRSRRSSAVGCWCGRRVVEVERSLQIPIGFMPQPSNGFETGNALKTENTQAIETMDQSCSMSQAQLTRAFQCNKTLPYPVNDCMQVRKVQSLLHTTESDMFLLERGFQPLQSSQPFQPKVNQPGKHFLIHPPAHIHRFLASRASSLG